MNNTVQAKWDNGITYETKIPEVINWNEQHYNGSYNDQFIENTTSLQGFSSLYSPNFCKGVR